MHDSLRVEVFAHEILVISVDNHLVSQQYVPELLQSIYYTEQFPFRCSVSGLLWLQLAAVEGNRSIVLGDDCSQLLMACICMDDKLLVEVRVRKHCFFCNDALHGVKRLLFLWSPFPLCGLGG